MSVKFEKLNLERRDEYRKDPEAENLLLEINRALLPLERAAYRDVGIDHPFIFVLGLPRSGTTLVTQLIARCLRTGYINNFVARFWLAPVTGIRLARAAGIVGRAGDFESTFGSTASLQGIHEFGYFWRHWLKKSTFEDIERAVELESSIDWRQLYRTLANIQREFDAPIVMKNMLGIYHLSRLEETLKKVVYVYIQRDELDVAESILKARRQHYSNPDKWWSYVPPDFRRVIGLDYWHQIAGQVALLKAFLDRELGRPETRDNVVRVDYAELANDPAAFLARLSQKSVELYREPLEIVEEPPRLEFRGRDTDTEERATFRRLLEEFRSNDGFEMR